LKAVIKISGSRLRKQRRIWLARIWAKEMICSIKIVYESRDACYVTRELSVSIGCEICLRSEVNGVLSYSSLSGSLPRFADVLPSTGQTGCAVRGPEADGL